jgi:hypothetical protein
MHYRSVAVWAGPKSLHNQLISVFFGNWFFQHLRGIPYMSIPSLNDSFSITYTSLKDGEEPRDAQAARDCWLSCIRSHSVLATGSI